MATKKQGYIKAFGSFLAGKLLSIYKLSIVVGSQTAFFSATNFCMPLIGAFGGVSAATAAWGLLLAVRVATGTFSWSLLAFYIPGYCAALYLATPSRIVRCAIPLACMALFLVHPVGIQAALYSSYWLIPVLVSAMALRSFFAQTLGATFTAHAVGSVIWLYTVPMAPAAWLALMPIVALERMTFAAGMVVMYAVISRMAGVLPAVVRRRKKLSSFLVR